MADMIEYLNGPVTSEWGRRRAENGHPEPYGVKYIGIGNEEVLFNGDRADEYDTMSSASTCCTTPSRAKTRR